MVSPEELEACKTWVQKGPDSNYNENTDILDDFSYEQCDEIVKGQKPGAAPPSAPVHTVSSVVAAAPSRLHIPNLFKSEFFIVVSLSILLPLLVIGFYTGWKYKWPEDKKKSPP